MTKPKKDPPPQTDPQAEGGHDADLGRPSLTTKGATTKLAESIHELAVGQKHLTLLVCKKLGIPLPKELSQEFEVSVNFIEQYSMKEAKVDKLPVPLDLDNPQVLLEPCFHVLLWESKGEAFSATAISDVYGVDGAYILSFRRRVQEMWPDITPGASKDLTADIKILAHAYLALRHNCIECTTEDAEELVKSFFLNHRDLMKRLRAELLRHHVFFIRQNCGSTAAAKYEAAMGILSPENNPVNSGGAVKSAMITMSVSKDGDQDRRSDRRGDRRNGDRTRKRVRDSEGRTKCDHCDEYIPHKGFREHNKVCKGKSKGK